jgi:hypothetical protein
MPVCSIQPPGEFTGLRFSRYALCRVALHRRSFRVVAHLIVTMALVFLGASASVARDSGGKMELKTTAFRPGGTIPAQYTCSGEDISPDLSWNDPPPGTESFVLIVDDLDAPAGTWVHWVVYDLPPSARQLPEHVPMGKAVAGSGKQGANSFPTNGYGGPCPPPGKPHRYFFRLYALDTVLNLRAPAHRQAVDAAMKGHVLAQAELMGTFGR